MAITLEEAKKNVQDDLQMGVIDEFQKSNYILEHITFDDAVSPTGGGATPSYSYTRLKTQPTAGLTSSAGAGTVTETAGLTATVRDLRSTWTNIIRLITTSRHRARLRFMRKSIALKTERWILTPAHSFRLRALIRANGPNHLICAQAQSL